MSFPLESRAPKAPALSSHLSSWTDLEGLGRALSAAAAALAAVAEALQGSAAPPVQSTTPRPLLNDSALQRPSRTTIARNDCPLWGELVRDFLLHKARAGRSDRYLRQLRASLGPWVQGRSRRDAAQITTRDLEEWIEDRGGAARTRKGFMGDLRTLFAWAVRRGILTSNPAAALEAPRASGEREIHIHTPDQVSRVLRAAYAQDKAVGRHLAIRYFAGIRSAEAHRIREDAILLDRGMIEVSAARSKTRSRRLVTIQPALRAFLALGGELRPLSPNTIRSALKPSKVEWSHNVTRHTFVSYHLACFGSAGRTAMEAGHAEAVLFRHYRALVTTDSAEAFWALRP